MKILNLYAGIGGNRKLWSDEHEITAVEYNQSIAAVYKSYFANDNVIIADAHQYLLEHYKEYDFIWSSFPCQTHSRARLWGWKNSDKVETKYPDLGLYQEIIFLQNYFEGLWVVENVKPYYEPLIRHSIELGRHLFWSNFKIEKYKPRKADIKNGNRKKWIELHGFDLTNFKIDIRKDQVYRNCVHPETGLHIMNCALNKFEDKKQQQLKLF